MRCRVVLRFLPLRPGGYPPHSLRPQFFYFLAIFVSIIGKTSKYSSRRNKSNASESIVVGITELLDMLAKIEGLFLGENEMLRNADFSIQNRMNHEKEVSRINF